MMDNDGDDEGVALLLMLLMVAVMMNYMKNMCFVAGLVQCARCV